MIYVERKDGAICGLFSAEQYKGQECLADDNPEVVAFTNRDLTAPRKSLIEQIIEHPEFADLKAELAK